MSIFFPRAVISTDVVGLPFFAPFFDGRCCMRIWAGNQLPSNNGDQVVHKIMSPLLRPLQVGMFKSKIEYHDFRAGDVRRPYSGVTPGTAPLDHPDGAGGHRLEYKERAFTLPCDTDGFPGKGDRELLALGRKSDLVVYDATFTESENIDAARLGPSTWQHGIRLDEAGVKRFCLFDHAPAHEDDFIDALAAEANASSAWHDYCLRGTN